MTVWCTERETSEGLSFLIFFIIFYVVKWKIFVQFWTVMFGFACFLLLQQRHTGPTTVSESNNVNTLIVETVAGSMCTPHMAPVTAGISSNTPVTLNRIMGGGWSKSNFMCHIHVKYSRERPFLWTEIYTWLFSTVKQRCLTLKSWDSSRRRS